MEEAEAQLCALRKRRERIVAIAQRYTGDELPSSKTQAIGVFTDFRGLRSSDVLWCFVCFRCQRFDPGMTSFADKSSMCCVELGPTASKNESE